jgi:uncharacterized lipoprotein YddW (UPF0748 family)
MNPSFLVRTLVIPALTALALLAGIAPVSAQGQGQDGQYRAFWVDTYNSRLNSSADITAIVDRARSAGVNALFVQVRRRGDAWYLRGREPLPEGVAIDGGFDPLAEMLSQAHAAGIEVHAFVTVGAIWNMSTLPQQPDHVFNQHGFNAAGPLPAAANWLTRTRLPDGSQTSYGGYRFGTDFWLDFGHPDAAAYTVDLLVQLVKSYDLDGLHLDRLQYPELTEGGSASVGYNDVSLDRFRRHYARAADSDPSADDAAWSDWRRAQVTGLLRRIYLSVLAMKPRLKVSAGVVATGAAPTNEGGWAGTDAYARTFQDWRSWMEDGLLDVVVPLDFRAEHQASESDAFNGWVNWTRDHQYQRQALIGLGSYLNSIEGTLRQIRTTMQPAANPIDGVVLYSMGAHNAPVTRNPIAVPAGRDTPLRPFDDLSSGLRTGRTVSGQALESGITFTSSNGAGGVFASSSLPALTWKNGTARTGHVMGTVTNGDGRALDTATVVLESEDGGTRYTTATDGGGFFGRVDLAPGTWRVSVMPSGDGRYASDCALLITAGQVTSFNLDVNASRPGIASCQSSPAFNRR